MAARDFKDYYEILGVERSASNEEIRDAFRKAARTYHPDVAPTDKKIEYAQFFKQASEAYDVLYVKKGQDTSKKAAYDLEYDKWKSGEEAVGVEYEEESVKEYPKYEGGVSEDTTLAVKPKVVKTKTPETPQQPQAVPAKIIQETWLRKKMKPVRDLLQKFFNNKYVRAVLERWQRLNSLLINNKYTQAFLKAWKGVNTKVAKFIADKINKVVAWAAKKLAVKAGAQALGSAIPIVGNVVAFVVTDVIPFLRRHGKKLAQAAIGAGILVIVGVPAGVAAGAAGVVLLIGGVGFLAAGLSALLFSGIVSFIIVVFLIVIVFLIIQFGAFVVPVGTIPVNPGIVVSGTCPLTGYVTVLEGSYNPQGEAINPNPPPQRIGGSGHGSNAYWNAVGVTQCTLAIPVWEMYGGCMGPDSSVSNSRENYCINASGGTCPYYGYALDVVSDNIAVYLPTLCDGVSCPPLNWRMVYKYPVTVGGYSAIFDADGLDHSYRLALIHIDTAYNPGDTLTSGTQIGTLANLGANTHLHIELNIDGTPVRPDFMCGGGYYGPGSVPGWYIRIPFSQLSSMVASRPSEFGSQTCSWSGTQGLAWAVNANLFATLNPPDGPAGYMGEYTNEFIDHLRSLFYTFVITNSGSARIIGGYRVENIPLELRDLSNYRLAVTGASYDSFPVAPRPRTILGMDSSNVYIMVLPSALPLEAEAAIRSLGATQSFLLDGGGSTTLCQGGTQLWPSVTARTVSNSIGGTSGDIIIMSSEPQP